MPDLTAESNWFRQGVDRDAQLADSLSEQLDDAEKLSSALGGGEPAPPAVPQEWEY